MSTQELILASSSPRRRELLAQLGLVFSVHAVAVDESCREGEDLQACVERVSLHKARAVLALFPDAIVVGSDTMVIVDGRAMGKPANRAEGLQMLESLSANTHEVLTGVAVMNQDKELVSVQRSRVSFRPVSPEEIAAYWATGEPADKAGAYAIQGLGAQFVKDLQGSYSGVMGLPLFETAQLLTEFGIRPLEQVDA